MGRKRNAESVFDSTVEEMPVNRLAFESELWGRGLVAVAGVDEVGRGCLFGDVVAAAVILPVGLVIEEVNDSKQVSEKKRDMLYDRIVAEAVAWSVARIEASVIDEINIRQASRLAMKHAVLGLGVQPEHLLVDAETVGLDVPQSAIIKGDALSQSIAAASILAKVTRDRLCVEVWEQLYPGYGIAGHKGYATKTHREAIEALGPTPLHRRSFLGNILAEQQVLF